MEANRDAESILDFHPSKLDSSGIFSCSDAEEVDDKLDQVTLRPPLLSPSAPVTLARPPSPRSPPIRNHPHVENLEAIPPDALRLARNTLREC